MLLKIKDDMKKAMKEGQKERLSVIRMLLASLQNEGLAKRKELTESEIIAVVQREIKMRRKSIEEFEKGARTDLADQTKKEIVILEEYLPQQLSEAEVREIAQTVISELGDAGTDFGKVMGSLMPKVKGKTDGKTVQNVVKQLLSSK